MPLTVERSAANADDSASASTPVEATAHGKQEKSSTAGPGVWFWAAIAATIPFFFQLGVPAPTWLVFFLIAFAVGSILLKAERKIANTNATTKQEASLWYGANGVFVMLFGVYLQFILAAVAAFSSTGSFQGIFAPFALVSILVPIGNLLSWQAIRQGKQTSPLLRRFISGLSCVIQLVCFVFAIMIWFQSCIWIAALALPLVLISLLLNYKLWTGSFSGCSNKDRMISAIAVGIASFICLIQTSCGICNWLAVVSLSYPDALVRSIAFKQLQKNDVAESLVASVYPFFTTPAGSASALPVSKDMGADAFYRLTGTAAYAMLDNGWKEDAFYAAPSIGTKSTSLELSASKLNSTLNKKDMTVHFDWSFIFKTAKSGPGQEARMLISLPPGAAVADLRMFRLPSAGARPAPAWQQSLSPSTEALTIGLMQAQRNKYVVEAMRLKDPVLVSVIEGETLLLQSAPILEGVPMKVQLSVVAPLSGSAAGKNLQVRLPRILDSNLKRTETLQFQSSGDSSLIGKYGKPTAVSFQMHQPTELKSSPVYQFTNVQGQQAMVQRRLSTKPAHIPARLVIALDGSASNLGTGKSLASAMKVLPPGFVAKLLVADPVRGLQIVDSTLANSTVNATVFRGGDKNWDLLAAAINVARKEKADVLWVHAAKPWVDGFSYYDSWNAKYATNLQCPQDIAGLCNNSVKIFDFQGESGMNEIVERIHASGGDLAPFIPVEQNGNGTENLKQLFESWSAGFKNEQRFEYSVVAPAVVGSAQIITSTNSDLLTLAHQHEVELLSDAGQRSAAESAALKHGIVSLYTAQMCSRVSEDPAMIPLQVQQIMPSASLQAMPRQAEAAHLRVLESKRRHHKRALHRRNGAADTSGSTKLSAAVPAGDGRLHGASSGTIPAGDATVITGVNTSGTVRVNNLAVLETVLNIIANGCEIIFLAWGVPSMIVGLLQIKTSGGRLRSVLGLVFALIGLAIPGMINWLVASSRDGGGFS